MEITAIAILLLSIIIIVLLVMCLAYRIVVSALFAYIKAELKTIPDKDMILSYIRNVTWKDILS